MNWGMTEDELAVAERMFVAQAHPELEGRPFSSARAWYFAGFADALHRPLSESDAKWRELFSRVGSHHGWHVTFLAALAHTGNVLAASLAAGITRQTAYRTRRRSATFRSGWEAAIKTALAGLRVAAEAERGG